ncbi:MAG: endonuclease/exonuclease/phosphatase family protein [Anaerolineae bacterium]
MNARGEILKTIGKLLSLVYIGTLLLILGLDQTSRDAYPFFALLTTFSIFLFTPLLVVGAFWLYSRSRVALAVFVVGIGLLLAAHPIFPQKTFGLRQASAEEAVQLEAMAFNTGWTVTPPRQLASVLAQQSADFIVMPEVSHGQIRAYERRLKDIYPYQVFDSNGVGAGLISKHPIESYEWLTPESGRPMLHATVDWNGQLVHVFTVHLVWPNINWHDSTGIPIGLNEYYQARQIDFLLNQARAVDGPVLLMGDYNMSDQSHTYKILSEEYGDAFRDGGWGFGFTFPNSMHIKGQKVEVPLVRIDYIFYSDHFEIVGADVDCIENRSDHCALKAVFQ